jgi:hypothetical protein
MRLSSRLAILVYCISGASFAVVPGTARFISDKRASGGLLQIVSWVRVADTFTVTLHKETPTKSDTVLLTGAKCGGIKIGGYHCFIKPFRRAGILITDVDIVPTTPERFDINEIVLIGGSVTATSLIGRDFVEAPS